MGLASDGDTRTISHKKWVIYLGLVIFIIVIFSIIFMLDSS